MKTIGFIGVGNIASTIIKGLSSSKLDIKLLGYNHGHVNKHVEEFSKTGVMNFTNDINDLINNSDYIIMAVKPDIVKTVCSETDKSLITNKIFMSVAAGIKLADYETYLGQSVKFVRVMPNVNAAVKESMTALCPNKNVSDDELNFCLTIFNQVGKTVLLDEKSFDIFMPIAGSFPAVVYMIIDSLVKVATEYGMDKKLATEVAVQTLSGSTEYALKEGLDKGIKMPILIDRVCSPKGTTINGVELLEKNNFYDLIKKTIEAMMKPKQ